MSPIKDIPLLIPAAGMGSRLFPATWGIPKELFPLGNKPAIHYILEEAMNALSIRTVICVTSLRKESLLAYLTYREKCYQHTIPEHERQRLVSLETINAYFNYHFALQAEPLGVGHAMHCAAPLFSDQSSYFCMMYPDDILLNKNEGIAKLIMLHKKYHCSVIAIQKVALEHISAYGVISYNDEIEEGVFSIETIIEKPKKEDAPSCYGIIGRYILTSKLFEEFSHQSVPCFISALNTLLKKKEKIIAVVLNTQRLDIGTVAGWSNAVRIINMAPIIEKKEQEESFF